MRVKSASALINEWVEKEKARHPSVEQYGWTLRPLIGPLTIATVRDVDEAQLVSFAMLSSTEAMRTKTVSGLVAFFHYLVNEGAVPRHPAPNLREAVKKAVTGKRFRDELVASGLPSGAADLLCWKHVACALFCGAAANPGGADQLQKEQVGTELARRLLLELRFVDAAELTTLLGQSIYS